MLKLFNIWNSRMEGQTIEPNVKVLKEVHEKMTKDMQKSWRTPKLGSNRSEENGDPDRERHDA